MSEQGAVFHVVATSAPLRRHPQSDAALDTEALRGETVLVFEEREGWARARLVADGYEGFLPTEALAGGLPRPPTHKIEALRSFLFPGPDIKLPPFAALPFGSTVAVIEKRGDFCRVGDGFLWARHLVPIETVEPDFVATAERFLGVPYLWGGKTALGLDCSGLVQVALAAAGRPAPRDSGPQERSLGTRIEPTEPVRRGDLVFWRGHVGLLRDAETLLHANGYAMAVTSEPLAGAVARIEASGAGGVSSVKRL